MAVDAAWERIGNLLQASVEQTCSEFEQELLSNPPDKTNSGDGAACAAWGTDSVRADLERVRASGDGELLEAAALDLFVESLNARTAACFWKHFCEESPDRLKPGWTSRLCQAALALQRLQTSQKSLLLALHARNVDRLLKSYQAAFRVAFSSSMPLGLAECVQLYFRQTWKRCLNDRKLHGSTACTASAEVTEWWWSGMAGEQSPAGPVGRVLALLNPLRCPSMMAAWDASARGNSSAYQGASVSRHGSQAAVGMHVAHTGAIDSNMDAVNCEGDNLHDGDIDCDEEESEDGSDDQSQCPKTDEEDLTLETLRRISAVMHKVGLGLAWGDLVMQFFAEQLTFMVEDRCQKEYDAKGLLDRLTTLLYDPMLRWLRAAQGVATIARSTLPRAAESRDCSMDATWSSDEEEGAAFEFHAEETWWCAARRAVLQLFEKFLQVRIGQAFDMVRDFPDSIPALLDLRRCLVKTGQSALLIQALRQQITRRLLIAGAPTHNVIKVYIQTIKALRLVDPRGLLLEGVSSPIRDYLKRRKDTVRCIITALTENSDLQRELQSGPEALPVASASAGQSMAESSATAAEGGGASASGSTSVGTTGSGAPSGTMPGSAAVPADANAGNAAAMQQQPVAAASTTAPPEPPDFDFVGGAEFEASEDEEDPDLWIPDPVDVDPQLPPRQRKAQDIISLLVSIYGSKEMFIKEYKEMLADRLLGNATYSTDREMQNLELLKKIFGETALSHCEVMLQDIKDSKRINGNVQQQQPSQEQRDLAKMQALVLSQHYWPSALAKSDHPRFKLPQPLEDALAAYGGAYTRVRAKRSLQWKRGHGLVEMTVRLRDRSLTVTVSPIHYAALACFSDSKDESSEASAGGSVATPGGMGLERPVPKRLSLQEISSRLELPEALVRKHVGFWLAKGVMKETSSGVFELQESLSNSEGAGANVSTGHHLDEDADHSPAQDAMGADSSTGRRHDLPCAAELQACESMIQNMLTNYRTLPLERIHNFLQMFMMDPAYTHTEAQLRDFLTRLCQNGRLEFDGSSYALVKQGSSP